jgi:hypothetical protein
MSVSVKILIFAILNFLALICLLIKLFSSGNNLAGSLRLAWDLILGRPDQTDYSIYTRMIWVSILRKSWWFMLIIYSLAWIITDSLYMNIGIILLVLIHVFWFLYASMTFKTKYDRIVHFTSEWGIIYKEIGEGSFFVEKSLAELDLRKKNLLILAIERNNQLNPFPKGLERIEIGDRIVMFGDLGAYQTIFS